MKFLIIRFSEIGEIVMTTPLVRCLRKQFPNVEIHYLVKDNCRSAIEFNPNIDILHVLAHSVELMLEELKNEGYDHIIDLQNDNVSQLVCKTLGVKTMRISANTFKSNFLKSFLRFKTPHFVETCFKAASPLKLQSDGGGLDYYITAHEETKRNDIPASHYAGYIVCGIGSAVGARKWPIAKWKEFCEQLDHPMILVGTKDDVAAANEIASVDDIKIYNACGKFSINETADLISKSKLLVTHENDLLHIAAAYKRLVISLWGDSASLAAKNPYYGRNFLTGHQELPFDTFFNKRIASIVVSDLLAAVKKRL